MRFWRGCHVFQLFPPSFPHGIYGTVEKTVENVENLVESVETIDFTMKFAVDMPQDSVFFGEFSTGILDKGKNKP
ncbi:MAG: hypothetical protein IJE40_00845 [Clostridia bacterium]|nr:hypothetical protein [Clostridia bacterium]